MPSQEITHATDAENQPAMSIDSENRSSEDVDNDVESIEKYMAELMGRYASPGSTLASVPSSLMPVNDHSENVPNLSDPVSNSDCSNSELTELQPSVTTALALEDELEYELQKDLQGNGHLDEECDDIMIFEASSDLASSDETHLEMPVETDTPSSLIVPRPSLPPENHPQPVSLHNVSQNFSAIRTLASETADVAVGHQSAMQLMKQARGILVQAVLAGVTCLTSLNMSATLFDFCYVLSTASLGLSIYWTGKYIGLTRRIAKMEILPKKRKQQKVDRLTTEENIRQMWRS